MMDERKIIEQASKNEFGSKWEEEMRVFEYAHSSWYDAALDVDRLTAALIDACQTVVDGYEMDRMEGMWRRDEIFYNACKDALEKVKDY